MRSANKLGRMVTADVDKALANIGSVKPDMSGGDEELKKAVAPQRAETFAEAFRRNRAEKGAGQTFTWGGKSYSTNMAGEGAKRSAATTTSRPAATSAPAKSTEVKPATPGTNTRASTELARTAARSQAAIREKRAENQADFRKRMQVGRSGVATAGISASRPKDKVRTGADVIGDFFTRQREREKEIGRQASKPKDYAAERAKMKAERAAREARMNRPYEKVAKNKAYAKGGSIDGCAVRGKTRAMRKKGK